MNNIFSEKKRKVNRMFRQARSLDGFGAEKEAVMKNVRSYLKENPLDESAESVFVFGSFSYRYSLSSFFEFSKKEWAVSAAALAAVFFIGGTAIAANFSLPGDFLYPFKIGVNENVQFAFTFGDKAKAQLEVDKAEERLDELKKLVAGGKISDPLMKEAEANFNAHSSRAEEIISIMKANGDKSEAEAISSEFENFLRSRQKSFALISQTDSKNNKSADEISNVIGVYLPESAGKNDMPIDKLQVNSSASDNIKTAAQNLSAPKI